MPKDYSDKLNHLYDSKYYTKDNGKCRYFNDCSLNITDPTKYYSDRVKVGEKYGERFNGIAIPKIVFCGLEGVHNGISNKQIPSINLKSELSMPSLDATNNHYRGVRYVLTYLLAGVLGWDKPDNATLSSINKPEYNEFLRYYCLTNMYRCAFGEKTSGLHHSREMKDNCQRILFDELDILKPDVFVIQSLTNNPINFWGNFHMRYSYDDEIARAERNDNTSLYRFYYEDGTPFLCLWTYHGNGFPYNQKDHSENRACFVNNEKYLKEELNPVMDVAIEELKNYDLCNI